MSPNYSFKNLLSSKGFYLVNFINKIPLLLYLQILSKKYLVGSGLCLSETKYLNLCIRFYKFLSKNQTFFQARVIVEQFHFHVFYLNDSKLTKLVFDSDSAPNDFLAHDESEKIISSGIQKLHLIISVLYFSRALHSFVDMIFCLC